MTDYESLLFLSTVWMINVPFSAQRPLLLDRTIGVCKTKYYSLNKRAFHYEAASELCGGPNVHLLFLETREEENFLRSNGMLNLPTWLGVLLDDDTHSPELGLGYHRYPNGSTAAADYLPLNMSENNFHEHVVMISSGRWVASSNDSPYNVICEWNECSSTESVDPWVQRATPVGNTVHFTLNNCTNFETAERMCEWLDGDVLYPETQQWMDYLRNNGHLSSTEEKWQLRAKRSFSTPDWPEWVEPNYTPRDTQETGGQEDAVERNRDGEGIWPQWSYNVICEVHSSVPNSSGAVSDVSLPELDDSSAAIPQPICEPGGRFRDVMTRSVLLDKVSAGLWTYAPLSRTGRLIECVHKCLVTELCCHIRYDPRGNLCFWLRPEKVYPLIDCATEDCYQIHILGI